LCFSSADEAEPAQLIHFRFIKFQSREFLRLLTGQSQRASPEAIALFTLAGLTRHHPHDVFSI
jgi:hypothetical protein